MSATLYNAIGLTDMNQSHSVQLHTLRHDMFNHFTWTPEYNFDMRRWKLGGPNIFQTKGQERFSDQCCLLLVPYVSLTDDTY
jgi:hypothetical protein